MKIPKGLQPLIDDGMVDTVVRRLKSGKEASVYIVACGGEAVLRQGLQGGEQRGFHKLAQYQEGRKTRSSRDARAMGKRGRHGRRIQEAEWKNAEVDALYRLVNVGVRVPVPHLIHEGVLLMELVQDAHGEPAPRLNDMAITADQARRWHAFMIAQIVRMLCAGLIHGDLSDFNVLLDTERTRDHRPAAGGERRQQQQRLRHARARRQQHARDLGRAAPELLETEYAHEIWQLYEAGELQPDSVLSGRFPAIPPRPTWTRCCGRSRMSAAKPKPGNGGGKRRTPPEVVAWNLRVRDRRGREAT